MSADFTADGQRAIRGVPIPANLDMDPATRLRLVADIIEAAPELHDQDEWTYDPGLSYSPDPVDLAGEVENVCGTTSCMAGWAVRLAPYDVVAEVGTDWDAAGAAMLGLNYAPAHHLFFRRTLPTPACVAILRRLAARADRGIETSHAEMGAIIQWASPDLVTSWPVTVEPVVGDLSCRCAYVFDGEEDGIEWWRCIKHDCLTMGHEVSCKAGMDQ